ncbi:MAG: hypothetical protein ACTHN3_02275 [Solirubrobacterales bacterium]
MAHGVDAGMDSVKAAGAQTPVDLFFASAFSQKLTAPHHPVLAPGKLGDRPVVSTSP